MADADQPPDAAEVSLVDEVVAAGVEEAVAQRWIDLLPGSYRALLSAQEVAVDVATLADQAEVAPSPDGLHVRFREVAPMGAVDDEEVEVAQEHPRSRLVVASAFAEGSPLELSRLVPILERLGFWVVDAQHWTIDRWWVHRVGLRLDGPGDPATDGPRWSEAVEAAWQGRTDVDALDGLVTAAGLTWDEVAVLRAFVAHRLQVDHRYSLDEVAEVLLSSPASAAALVELFARRFDPERRDLERATALVAELTATCDGLESLEDDRILRGLVGTVDAVVRTNRWIRPDQPLAVKLDPSAVPDLPDPRPAHEAWVHGRLPGGGSVRGVHLRAGVVSRGGIRWSDRRHDMRTEVLDLMRTQVLKNAPIVPTGAKGGFVVDGAEAAEAYDAFIGALLDLTDDRDGDEVVPVPCRLDGDDTYLVVAADKGTASFSDRANHLSLSRGYWLGDAFASGGAHGYDHKALGVTARGAWEAVVHHFGRLGVDPRAEEITVVGIGDMSGDVFGNFALRSPHLKVVAAFDHRHVFCDPDPDPARSFEERRRLAAMDRSSWDDYDRELLSDGGFIAPRTQKQVQLTRQVRGLLRIEDESLTPAELVQAILRAPVDLLFAGGIGTFVRSRTEDDATLDDRVNSELRVTAEELRARVVGEGANLAVTQRGRIAYARRGGRINRDAIDNAAGVDSSDHEVNLKVLLDLAVGGGDLTVDERNDVLAAQTEAVVGHVLGRVRRQCERLTFSEVASSRQPAWFERVLHRLVSDGVLDRDVEVLPDEAELSSRREAGAGLTRPELAVILAGVKRWLTAEVLDSSLPDEDAARSYLVDAFPDEVARRFDALLDRHPLRRELIASGIVNDVVDHLGITFVHRIAHDTGAGPDAVVRAALIAQGIAGADAWWDRLADAPARPLSDPDFGDGRSVIVELCERLTRAELVRRTDGGGEDVASRIAADQPVAAEMAAALRHQASADQRRSQAERARTLSDAGLADDVAAALAVLPDLRNVHDLAELSRRLNRPAGDLVAGYSALDDALGLERLARTIGALELDGRWPQAAQAVVLDDLARFGRDAIATAVEANPGHDSRRAVDELLDARAAEAAEAVRFCREAESDPAAGLPGMTVVVRALRRIL